MAEAEDLHKTEYSQQVEDLQTHQEQVDEDQGKPAKDENKPSDVEQAVNEAAQPEPAAADSAADEGTAAAEDKEGSPAAAVTEPAKEASEQDLAAAAEEDAVVHKPVHAEVQHASPEVQHTAPEVQHTAPGVQEVVKEEEQQQQQDDEQVAVQQQHAHVRMQHNTSPTRVLLQESRKVAHSVAASQGGPFSHTAADGRLLSFSAPPYVPKAKPYRRVDYSHSSVQLMKIAHDNQLLVNHLTTIGKAVPAWTKDVSAPPAPGNTASSAVNRRKQATVIAQENHALYQRLVAIRPSKDISRETLEAGHRQNELYRANCAQFKSPGSPKGKAVPASP